MKLLSRREANPNPELERRKGECLATWWHQATPGTTYWRCLVPARHLPGQSIPVDIRKDLKERRGQIRFPRQRGEAAIWQFLGDENRSKMAFGMRALAGTKLLLEVDDNYTRTAPYMRGRVGAPWVETIEEAKKANGYSHEMHRKILPIVDGVICATDYLANVYSEYNDNVFVCPNSIDPVDWQYEREEHEPFRIVYYGSSSHIKDMPLVTKALKWASRQPGVEVWTAGLWNPSWSFEYQKLPWENDLAAARKNLFKFDLGIAPLVGNKWSRGKSDVKILEYAMAGVLPLMSYEEPYRPWFDEFPDLCLADKDWMESIQYWVKHRDEVPYAAAGVKEWALETRSIDRTIHTWKEAISK